MDISAFGMAGVAAITVICYLVGWIVKVSGLDNKWIPVIVGACGGVLGVVGMLVMTDFPAADPLTAARWESSAASRPQAWIRLANR